MARPGKPWWWSSRGCWAATVGGKRITAPPGISKADRIEAELWYDRVAKGNGPSPVGAWTVARVIGACLTWTEPATPAERRQLGSRRSLFRTLLNTRISHRRLGDHWAAQIKAEHMDAAVRVWAKEGRSPGYQRSLCSQWKAAWAWAHRRIADRDPVRILPDNPLREAKIPSAVAVEERFAERTEAAAWLRWLRRAKGPDFALLQRCLILTGARPSEWTRATWGEIQWDARPMPMLVRQSWKAAKKAGKPRRIFIPPALARALKRRRGEPGALIFVTPRDRVAWSPSNLATATQRFRREAIADGLAIRDDGADRLTCYRWRHTAASTLLMRGVDVSTVAELLGTSVLMIQRHYGHLLNAHLAVAAARLARSR